MRKKRLRYAQRQVIKEKERGERNRGREKKVEGGVGGGKETR